MRRERGRRDGGDGRGFLEGVSARCHPPASVGTGSADIGSLHPIRPCPCAWSRVQGARDELCRTEAAEPRCDGQWTGQVESSTKVFFFWGGDAWGASFPSVAL